MTEAHRKAQTKCRIQTNVKIVKLVRTRMVHIPVSTYQISPPEPFELAKPGEFERWLRHFQRFRIASNLSQASDGHQVNIPICCMGDKADDILCVLGLTETQRKVYNTVQEHFREYFTEKRYVIYKRAKFNSRKQELDEPVNEFITLLYSLSEHSEYGTLRDELIRDSCWATRH